MAQFNLTYKDFEGPGNFSNLNIADIYFITGGTLIDAADGWCIAFITNSLCSYISIFSFM